ncbi:nucleoside 2-deoxyribosyltransferase domain-containing protein [Patescibacteria group bacterium]|nr:nucleoside 2-deoxyribosyltransferase domain-containing protein [Patescibacteria group bacterium]
MQRIDAPSDEQPRFPTLFLAGGITNCPNWQEDALTELADTNSTIFNPRRKTYPDDPAALRQQISWEYERLRSADAILFWFAPGSLNPITLFELGSALERKQRLFIGADAGYSRIADLRIQIALRSQETHIQEDFSSLITDIRGYFAAHA